MPILVGLTKFKMKNSSQFQRLRAEYQKLISVTAELTSGLEEVARARLDKEGGEVIMMMVLVMMMLIVMLVMVMEESVRCLIQFKFSLFIFTSVVIPISNFYFYTLNLQ